MAGFLEVCSPEVPFLSPLLIPAARAECGCCSCCVYPALQGVLVLGQFGQSAGAFSSNEGGGER